MLYKQVKEQSLEAPSIEIEIGPPFTIIRPQHIINKQWYTMFYTKTFLGIVSQ